MKLTKRQRTYLRSSLSKRHGVALAAAVSMLSLLGVLLIVLLDGTAEKVQWSVEQERSGAVTNVADMGIALASEKLWSGFVKAYGPDQLQPWNFRTYLDGLGILDQAGALNPVGTDVLGLLGLATDANGLTPLFGGFLQTLEVVREDQWDSARLTISAFATLAPDQNQGLGKNQVRAQQTFQIQRPDWEGLDYALLANNVNCIMCHASVDDAARYYNQDPLARGTFNRVRVGSLESFHVRANPDSRIAGALYLGGAALREDGSPVSNWSSLSLKSASFDANAKLIEDAFGGLASANLIPADPLAPQAGGNLYLDYLAGGPEGQVDGALPDYFPSPFPDNGGFDPLTGAATPELGDNRVLDHNEFMAAAGSATGTILGGTVAVVPHGHSLTSLSALDSTLLAGSSTLSSLTAGHVLLVGTELNPIILNGPIAIDGDVVLSGVIKGTGSIMASGNVFIPSDLKFLDGSDGAGNRTYGVAADGTVNSLGIACGGNVTIGDPTHPSLGAGVAVDGTPATPFNFIVDEVAIFNRGEWMKTQPELPGKAVYTKTGTKTVSVLVTPTKQVTVLVDKDIYAWLPTGNMITKDVYGWVQTGTKVVDDYKTIHHPADPPAPYGSPWDEKIWIGSHLEPVFSWQKTGTQTVPETAYMYVRTDQIPTLTTVPDGAPYWEDRVQDVWEWVTPMHPNPFYAGLGFIPRYYAFDANAPVPIFNKKGYFDPLNATWKSAERAEGWNTGRLTLADPSDSSDPILFDAAGNPKAVISTLTPSQDWMSNDVLAALVDRELSQRNASDPVEIDATLYSANSVFGVVPVRGQPGVSGRMLINGGLVAADLGLLAPSGIQINYDSRNRDLLQVADDRTLSMRRALWAPAAKP